MCNTSGSWVGRNRKFLNSRRMRWRMYFETKGDTGKEKSSFTVRKPIIFVLSRSCMWLVKKTTNFRNIYSGCPWFDCSYEFCSTPCQNHKPGSGGMKLIYPIITYHWWYVIITKTGLRIRRINNIKWELARDKHKHK